ncbi:MAG: hypothetical protein JWM80_6547 [Cyanobacteria bacterium RYN_339]|nr:hypothetical protein [Cyanobacteria bacterium RYN_339]
MNPTQSHPIEFAQASPTEIQCLGASGLAFYLPVVPVCGHPGRATATESRRPA